MAPTSDVRLFPLPGGRRQDPQVARWFEARPPELASIARRWFGELQACGPDVRVLLHDGQPTACVDELAFGYVGVFRSHVNLGFFLGARLADPAGLLQGTGRFMRHVKLRPSDPAPDAAALRALVHAAYADMRARRVLA